MTLLAEHATIPISFEVTRVLLISMPDTGIGSILITETAVDVPWVKDYDSIDDPRAWPSRFDVTNWGLIAAYDGKTRVGGAVVAYNTPEVTMLRGRTDLAVLLDIRVEPTRRSTGVGSGLLRMVEDWARARGCRTLMIETQNINVPACHFYARMGCQLGAVDRYAYPGLPGEAQMLWFKEL